MTANIVGIVAACIIITAIQEIVSAVAAVNLVLQNSVILFKSIVGTVILDALSLSVIFI
jgi:hypothetical protein